MWIHESLCDITNALCDYNTLFDLLLNLLHRSRFRAFEVGIVEEVAEEEPVADVHHDGPAQIRQRSLAELSA